MRSAPPAASTRSTSPSPAGTSGTEQKTRPLTTVSNASARNGSASARARTSGMPAAVLEGLTGSDRLPSQQGSAGESGNGFGLVLARQTAQRMGGTLELGLPARGAEVLLRFPAVAA